MAASRLSPRWIPAVWSAPEEREPATALTKAKRGQMPTRDSPQGRQVPRMPFIYSAA